MSSLVTRSVVPEIASGTTFFVPTSREFVTNKHTTSARSTCVMSLRLQNDERQLLEALAQSRSISPNRLLRAAIRFAAQAQPGAISQLQRSVEAILP